MDNRLVHDIRSTQTDIGETLAQRSRRAGMFRVSTGPPPERRSTISAMIPSAYQSNTRMRNLSGGSSGSATSGSSNGSSTNLDNQYSDNQLGLFSLEIAPFANSSSTVPASRGNTSSHRKSDRSWNDNDNERSGSHRSVNSSRYKTELCRPFEESGSCKYGDKCQFAHGYHELRNLARHPKYKTELCRTFHTVGFCPYGPRCHFIHEEDTKPEPSPKLGRAGSIPSSSGSSSPSLSPVGSDDVSVFSYQSEPSQVNVENRQINALTVNINNYGSNFDVQALERQFNSVLNWNRSCNENGNVFCASTTKEPKMIGTEERDIFSEITMFNAEDVLLDNAPKAPCAVQPSSCAMQSMKSVKLDNYSAFVDSSAYWQPYGENILAQLMRPLDPFHHSPTGSDGSSSSGSDCGGSTESLPGTCFNEWRSRVAIGQY